MRPLMLTSSSRGSPEALLIRRYVEWVGGSHLFQQSQSLDDGSWTDLFNRTRWTLFEAKVGMTDRIMREAFGQLHDYRRWFARKPRLAILLSAKPKPRILRFFEYYKVSAVWKTRRNSFADTVAGYLTKELRDAYRVRK